MKRFTISVLMLFILSSCIMPKPTPTQSPPISPVEVSTLHVLLDGEPTNELRNPGFERPFTNRAMSMNAPQGWGIWWLDAPLCQPGRVDCYIQCPTNCDVCRKADQGCYWATPEFAESWFGTEPRRVMQGNSSGKSFVYGRMGQMGYVQQVRTGIGKEVSFSAWMQGWQCFSYANCNGGDVSDMPYALHLKVGIDPMGGADPTAATVVWSNEGESFDDWARFAVTTTTRADVVTTFIHSRAEFDFRRENNNVYIDGAELHIVIEPPPPITYTNWVYMPILASNWPKAKSPGAFVLMRQVTPEWIMALQGTAWNLTDDASLLDSSEPTMVVVVNPSEFGLDVDWSTYRVLDAIAPTHAITATTPAELLAILRGG